MPAPYFNGPVRPTIAATAVAALRAYVSNLFVEAMVARISAVGLFEWAPLSIVADDGATVIIPNDIIHPAPGRWVLISFAAGALVGQITNGEVKQTGATAGQIFTSGAPTAGGAWSADVLLLAGGITSPGNKTWDLGTNTVTHGAAVWTPGADALKLTGRGFWCDGNTGAVPAAGAGTRAFWSGQRGVARFGGVSGTAWDDGNCGDFSFAGGWNCQASGSYSAAFCNSTASGGYAAATGDSTAAGDYTFATGHVASATLQGQVAESGASITGAAGGSQTTRIRLIGTSVDAFPVQLTLNGTAPGVGVRALIISGKTYKFHIEGVSKCTAGADVGKQAGWTQDGMISNVAGATALDYAPWNLLSTGLRSNATYTPEGCTGADAGLAAMTLTPTEDNANDCLALTFVGHIGVAVNTWHTNATVQFTEVM